MVTILPQSILIKCTFVDGKWLQFCCHQSKCWSCLSASKGGFAVPIVLKIPALPRSAWLDPPTRKLLCDFKHLLQRRRRSKVPITDPSSLAQEGAYLPLWVTMQMSSRKCFKQPSRNPPTHFPKLSDFSFGNQKWRFRDALFTYIFPEHVY